MLASRLALLLAFCLVACGIEKVEPKRELRAAKLPSWSLATVLPSGAPKWPQFVLAEEKGFFLWGRRDDLLRLAGEGESLSSVPLGEGLTAGLDVLIAAARSPDGTLAVLDSSGQVAVLEASSAKVTSFGTHFLNRPGYLALAGGKIYLLLQGDLEQGPAVVAYTLAGQAVGTWGQMPAGGVLQANLKGGGIAACPDGSVFYNYINSPRIYRVLEEIGKVKPVGRKSPGFRVLAARQIRRAQSEVRKSRSVAALVKLGLGTSRAQSLFCSDEGLLARQVAHPAGGGADVEIWDPRTERLLGTVPAGEGVLLAVRGRTLYLGVKPAAGGFSMDRIQLEIPPMNSSRLAGS